MNEQAPSKERDLSEYLGKDRDELRAIIGERDAEIEQLRDARHKNDRVNFETTEDGFRICRGYHHRSADCEWLYYVPRSTHEPCARHGQIIQTDCPDCERALGRTPEPLRPDGMPEPSLHVLKRVAARMRETAPDTAYLAQWAVEQIEEHDHSFDLRWKADMRAIKRWQEAHPGNDLTWPDHADLCVWLLEQLDARAAQPPRAEWQPIETAPNDDGFECLIAAPGHYPKHNNCLVGEARRYEDQWYWAQLDPSDGVPVHPTHWMPLPSPPTKAGE